eukprot:3475819-Pleurochrysis_carterae.AAC.1
MATKVQYQALNVTARWVTGNSYKSVRTCSISTQEKLNGLIKAFSGGVPRVWAAPFASDALSGPGREASSPLRWRFAMGVAAARRRMHAGAVPRVL